MRYAGTPPPAIYEWHAMKAAVAALVLKLMILTACMYEINNKPHLHGVSALLNSFKYDISA